MPPPSPTLVDRATRVLHALQSTVTVTVTAAADAADTSEGVLRGLGGHTRIGEQYNFQEIKRRSAGWRFHRGVLSISV